MTMQNPQRQDRTGAHALHPKGVSGQKKSEAIRLYWRNS